MHTPGPWEVSRGYNQSGYPCFFINGMSGDQKRDVATLDANARLMDASPDLYAAAQLAVAVLARGQWLPDSKDPEAVALRALQAAIERCR